MKMKMSYADKLLKNTKYPTETLWAGGVFVILEYRKNDILATFTKDGERLDTRTFYDYDGVQRHIEWRERRGLNAA